MKFLLVDDDHDFLALLKQGLNAQGYEADIADSIDKAVSSFSQNHYDVVTLDLNLKKASGFEIIQKIRHRIPNVYLLVVTGFASISTAVKSIKEGADDIISKPITARSLLKKVNLESHPVAPKETHSLHMHEWELIQEVLIATDYNITLTAKQLGISRRTLQRKLKKRPL